MGVIGHYSIGYFSIRRSSIGAYILGLALIK